MLNRFVLGLSMLALSFLAIGTHTAPGNFVFWLASASFRYQVIRIILITIFLIQIVTRPPRNVVIRLLTSAVAITVGLWTLNQTYAYQMPALDTLAFLSSSISLLVIALEIPVDKMKPSGSLKNQSPIDLKTSRQQLSSPEF